MQKFLEGLKDFLYDSIDYLIMIGIIGLVVFIIGWRLDLLFANDAKDIIPKDNIIAEEKEPKKEGPKEEKPRKPVEDTGSQKVLTINIPSGSNSSDIGTILESNGLVSSKSDFVGKAEEMQLSTKLKAGNYEIKSSSSLEDILKILTK